MTETRLPKWMGTNCKTIWNGQSVSREQDDGNWLTDPIDAQEGDTLRTENGSGEIVRVWFDGTDTQIEYRSQYGYTTVSASEVKHDPDTVIV